MRCVAACDWLAMVVNNICHHMPSPGVAGAGLSMLRGGGGADNYVFDASEGKYIGLLGCTPPVSWRPKSPVWCVHVGVYI